MEYDNYVNLDDTAKAALEQANASPGKISGQRYADWIRATIDH